MSAPPYKLEQLLHVGSCSTAKQVGRKVHYISTNSGAAHDGSDLETAPHEAWARHRFGDVSDVFLNFCNIPINSVVERAAHVLHNFRNGGHTEH